MNILIIANCRLGDSLIMLPALKLLRRHFPDAHIVLASETARAGFIAAKDILEGRGIVDDFIPMSAPQKRLRRLCERLRFIFNNRRTHWDLGIVLMPPIQPLTMELVRRFAFYLKLSGARRILAPEAIIQSAGKDGQACPSVVDLTLRLLEPLGIALPHANQADATLPELPKTPELPELPDAPLLAVAPGANLPTKCWPVERYAIVLKEFCASQHVTPVYFGGENERHLCEALNAAQPGIVCIGTPLANVEALMRRCTWFLGNDTGLGHLAAAVGLPCVSIHACRDIAIAWEPYTREKIVLRAQGIPCENCLKTICDTIPQPCLDTITPHMVLDALKHIARARRR